jgi:hypothetical protein
MERGLKPDVILCCLLARLKPCRYYKALRLRAHNEFFRSL